MALVKATLEAAIKAAFDSVKSYDGVTSGQEQQDAIDDVAAAIATAIDTFVKSATVTVTVASVSAVTPGAGVSGPGTGTGTVS